MKFRTYVLFWFLFGVVADTVIGLTILRGAPWWALAIMAAPTLAAGICLPPIGAGKSYTAFLRAFTRKANATKPGWGCFRSTLARRCLPPIAGPSSSPFTTSSGTSPAATGLQLESLST